jgi:hypothetical protein
LLIKEIHEYFLKEEILTSMFVGDKVTLARTGFAAWLPLALKGSTSQ